MIRDARLARDHRLEDVGPFRCHPHDDRLRFQQAGVGDLLRTDNRQPAGIEMLFVEGIQTVRGERGRTASRQREEDDHEEEDPHPVYDTLWKRRTECW
jgi:hypothetical protein